ITVERTRDGVTTVVGEPSADITPADTTPADTTPVTDATAPGAPSTAATGAAPTAASEAAPPGERRANTSPVTVTITVALGEPVTVRRANIAIEGAGGTDKYLREDL